MKKTIKVIICIALCSCMLLALTACSSKLNEKDIIGEYTGTVYWTDYMTVYTPKERTATCKLTLNKDGTYKIIATGGDDADQFYEWNDTWEIDDSGELVFGHANRIIKPSFNKQNGSLWFSYESYSIHSGELTLEYYFSFTKLS